MLQRVCSVVDHSWRQSVVRIKTWRSEPCDLNVTISASCDWSVAIFTTSLECQESYLTLRNVTSQITWHFFRLHNTFARLYNAAASPASRLRSAGSLAVIPFFFCIEEVVVPCSDLKYSRSGLVTPTTGAEAGVVDPQKAKNNKTTDK